MDFFDEIDSVKILERNAGKIEGMELNSARKLLKQYKKAGEALKLELLNSPDNSFTEAKLKNTLFQVERTIRELEVNSKPHLKTFFDDMSDFGVEDSAKEVNALEKHFNGISNAIDIDSVIESTDPDTFLFNNFESSVSTYNQTLRNGFQRSLTDSLIQQKPWSQAVFDMGQIFDLNDYILARIVRTELHGIYSGAKFKGFLSVKDQYLPDLKKTLFHPMDSRTGKDSIEANRLHLIVDMDKPFRYSYGGKTREFMYPPDRTNDRSILIPYRESWQKG